MTGERADPEPSRRPAGRAVIAVAVAAAVAILVTVLVLGSEKSWQSQLVASVPTSGGGAKYMDEPGDRACTAIPEVPSSAGRAEFQIAGVAAFRGRIEVRTAGRTVAGPMGRIAVQGDVARVALPAGTATREGSTVCLRSGDDALFRVLGDDGSAALRLVGSEPQSRISQLGAELERAGRATGAPFHGIGGWAALVFGLTALGGGLAIAAAVWSRDDAWRPGRRTWIAVAVVGLLHAWAWAALTPPYQVPDESAHVQYASYIADHGQLPTGDEGPEKQFSEKQIGAGQAVNLGGVAFRPDLRPPWSEREDDSIGPRLRGLSGDVPDGTTTATAQPPFYYVSVTAGAIGGGTALDMLARMRLLSAAWLAIAALGAMALVRSVAPNRPKWMVTGGLAVALFPLMGFLAGGVTPDVAMTALALWLYAAAGWCWRDGITRRNAAIFGLLLVLLALTKLTALAVVPGALVIVLSALVRDWRAKGRAVPLRAVGAGAAIALVPFVLFMILSVASGRAVVSGVVGGAVTAAGPTAVDSGLTGNIRENLVYTWQLFLFRLPMMQDFLGGVPMFDVWFEGLVGRFGYLDYSFSLGVRRVVTGVWAVIALLGLGGLVALVRGTGVRPALVRYGPLLFGGLIGVAGLMLVIGRVDYTSRLTGGPPFQQARYLLPALPVAVYVLILGLRGAGRRAAPFVAVLLIAGAALWAIGAFSITLTRYYG